MHAIAKIIARHAGVEEVEVGQIVNVTPDYVMMHDRGVARAMSRFEEMGGERVYDPSRAVVVFDHFFPAIRVSDAEAQIKSRAWIAEQGIVNFHVGEGIAHILFPERGYAFPGALIFGTDSHTMTNSALGCVAMGMGHSDVASFLAIGYNWLRVPEVVRIDVVGTLRPWVSAKDIILKIFQDFGEDAAPYQGVEYAGPVIRSMDMDGRLALCNMVTDFGGKTGYIEPDEITSAWMEGRRDRAACDPQTTDSPDDYADIIEINVDDLEPLVALPHDLSHIEPASRLGDVRIDEAVLGTCTGGRIEDFRVAAAVMKGKKLAPHARMIINPGSNDVYRQSMREGLIEIFIDAGAMIGTTGCGPCGGCQVGMMGAGENAITSSSRNFRGRMGSQDSNIYVASPASVAAAAIAGSIVHPETVAGEMASS